MAINKTQRTDQDVNEFIDTIADEKKKRDSRELVKIISSATGMKPYMYGSSIIGFGNYHYKYDSGREGDAPLAGFSPRKAGITLYVASRFPGKEEYLKKLGKCKCSFVCLYIKKLEDIAIDVFKEMTKASVNHMKKQYPVG